MFKLMILAVSLLIHIILCKKSTFAITSIKTQSSSTNLKGSVYGGTTLFINGVGFEKNLLDNQVIVGSYPCTLKDVTSDSLSCVTTSSQSFDTKSNLPIQVNKITSTFFFTYDINSATRIYKVIPSSSSSNKNVYIELQLKLQAPKIKFGQEFVLYQKATKFGHFYLKGNGPQQAGKYTISNQNKLGKGFSDKKLQRVSFTQQYYEIVQMPEITSIQKPGSGQGMLFKIYGNSFTTNKKSVQVTVDGIPCQIKTAKLNSVFCMVHKQKSTVSSSLLETDSSNQVNGYLGGSGFLHQQFSISGLSVASFRSIYQSNYNSLMLSKSQIVSQISLAYTSISSYNGHVIKGYFLAPADGSYKFDAITRDYFQLYISDKYGSAEIDYSQPYISNNGYYSYTTQFDSQFFYNAKSCIGQQLALQAGKYYYMELYLVVSPFNDYIPYFQLQGQMPNSDTNLKGQTHQVVQLTTNFTNQPQIRQFALEAVNGGNYTLKITRINTQTLNVDYSHSVTLPYNASIQEFVNALRQFNSYAPYGITGQLKTYTQFDTQTSDPLQIYKYVYTVNISSLRPKSYTSEKFSVDKNNLLGQDEQLIYFSQYSLIDHGPYISGNFNLQFNGQDIMLYNSSTKQYSNPQIPYNVPAATLADAFRNKIGFGKTEVYTLNCLKPQYTCTWIIEFKDVNIDLPEFGLTSNLVGGVQSSPPTIEYTVLRNYSTNLRFKPVDYQFLYTAAQQPHILLKVNNITANCPGNCSFSFPSTNPEINYLELSGNLLRFGITNPQNLLLDISTFQVTIDKERCLNPTGTLTNFSCQLPLNNNSQPDITAGKYYPELFIPQLGIIQYQSSVQQVQFSLALTLLNPISGFLSGGYQITLTGKHFPKNDIKPFVTVCEKNATVISSKSNEIKIEIPNCATVGITLVSVIFNLYNQSKNFEYIVDIQPSPSIASVTPNSISPVLKGTTMIEGAHFGQIAQNVKVFLSNSSGNIYPMKIIKMNDTNIQVGVSGGLPGNYYVTVIVKDKGVSTPQQENANLFVYELIVDNISPNQGSLFGGTLINITGKNFSPNEYENMVFVGNQVNWKCKIQHFQSEYILCRTPAKHEMYPNTVEVVVTVKVYMQSECSGACQFTYLSQAQSLTANNISINQTLPGSQITINGSNLAVGDEIIMTNAISKNQIKVSSIFINDTHLNFTVPDVQSGYYYIKIRRDPLGQSNTVSELLKIKMSISSITPINCSTKGGYVTLKGKGLPNKWPHQMFSLDIISNSERIIFDIQSTNTTQMKLIVPQGISNQLYSISLSNILQQKITKSLTQKSQVTPKLTLLTTGQSSDMVAKTYQFSKSTLSTENPKRIWLSDKMNLERNIEIQNWTNGTTISFQKALSPGQYVINMLYDGYGFADVNGSINVTMSSEISAQNVVMSYNGGYLTILGNNISQNAEIEVEGKKGKLVKKNLTSATFEVPALRLKSNTSSISNIVDAQDQKYPITKKRFTAFSNAQDGQHAFDEQLSSTSKASKQSSCFVGLDFGSSLGIKLHKMRIYPSYKLNQVAKYLAQTEIEVSDDNQTWSKIGQLGKRVRKGWNSFQFEKQSSSVHRYARLNNKNNSNCPFSAIQLYGQIYSLIQANDTISQKVDVTFTDGYTSKTFTKLVQYRQDKTPVINTISPNYGNVFGGYNITLTGDNLDGQADIQIDHIPCDIKAKNNTQIVCTVGQRSAIPTSNEDISFTVNIDNRKALLKDTFEYVLKWSDQRTWGVDVPPIDGDLVHVPTGMKLLLDQSTPKLAGIVVEGIMKFSDDKDIIVETDFITVNKGKLIAGTAQKPYQHDLTFIMTGNLQTKLQPLFGTKMIGCMNCQISLNGKKTQSWTLLQETVQPGSTTLIVSQDVNWVAGQQIVIASTSFLPSQAEKRVIVSVSNNRTIQVGQPLDFKHYGYEQTYGNKKLQIRAEVALLSRNIKIKGDEQSKQINYGAHLMLVGNEKDGMQANISFVQFLDCGQQRNLHFCVHFRKNEDLQHSQFVGNSIHDSFGRGIVLDETNYLNVSKNSLYNVRGNNLVLRSGTESYNSIQQNLIINVQSSWGLQQSDFYPSAYLLTNPSNNFVKNHAAGGNYYGVNYNLQNNVWDALEVCPSFSKILDNRQNVVHSFRLIGVNINSLQPRQSPCSITSNINGSLSNYYIYKNLNYGIKTDTITNVNIQNSMIAESNTLVQFQYASNFFVNNTLIGETQARQLQTNTNLGISLSLSNVSTLIGTYFANFSSSSLLLRSTSSYNIITQKTTFDKINGSYISLSSYRNERIKDIDGSFVTMVYDGAPKGPSNIFQRYEYLLKQQQCTEPLNPSIWDNTIVCSNALAAKKIIVSATLSNYYSYNLQITELKDAIGTPAGNKTSIINVGSYQLLIVMGKYYQITWQYNTDFSYLTFLGYQLSVNDPGVVFLFKYNNIREVYDIYDSGVLLANKNAILDPQVCINGDFYHNKIQKYLQVCIRGKSQTSNNQSLTVNAVICRYMCPKIGQLNRFTKQTFLRYWSNPDDWPSGKIPQQGENVTINGNWTMVMDINPKPINILIIDGDLVVDDKLENGNLTANGIWVRYGMLNVGNSSSQPFPNNFTIQLNGKTTDSGFVVDSQTGGNKMIVVTGTLNLFGKTQFTAWTKLTSIVHKGDTQLSVISAEGWNIGDQIVISPSYMNHDESQKVKITAINSQTISFIPPLRFNHYGASGVTINNTYGLLDTRASVGYLSRSIKIVRGPSYDHGYRLLIYGYNDGSGALGGYVNLYGVQISDGGQQFTEKASIQAQKAIVRSETSTIFKCSIYNCGTFCMNLELVKKFKITDNVIYNASNMHAKLSQYSGFIFKSNLMIYARYTKFFKSTSQVACLYAPQDAKIQLQIFITENVCQGSSSVGFIIPYTPCGSIDDTPFFDNLAGSCKTGFNFVKVDGKCMAANKVRAYACSVGQHGYPKNTIQLVHKNFLIADCGKASILLFSKKGSDQTAEFNDSMIIAISRPQCTQCYGPSAISCVNNIGIQMLTVTQRVSGIDIIYDDTIFYNEAFDGKAFLNGMKFKQYNITYSTLPQCSKNVVFRPHRQASGLVCSHHLSNSTCQNCQFNAYVYFDPPSSSQLGFFGGCGQMLCTGKNNYLIRDHDGSFFKEKGILLANNSEIGNSYSQCSYNSQINGHFCKKQNLGMLQFESIAPDFNKRIIWPVQINSTQSDWSNKINAQKQWSFDQSGNPANKRLGRFISTIQYNKSYDLTFSTQPPADLRLQFQSESLFGNPNDWIILKLSYSTPNSIRIMNRGIVVKPFILQDKQKQGYLSNMVCGENKYYHKNKTVHFVITGDKKCLVRVTLTNSVKVTARLQMTVEEFFNGDGQSKFIDRLCAVLDITDTSRVKIVGVFNGSSNITAVIQEKVLVDSQNATQNDNSTQQKNQMQEIQQKLNQIISTGQFNNELVNAGLGQILQTSVQASYVQFFGDQNQDNASTEENAADEQVKNNIILTLIIIVGVMVVVIVVVVIVTIVCAVKLLRKKSLNNRVANTSMIQIQKVDKDMFKDIYIMQDSMADFGRGKGKKR